MGKKLTHEEFVEKLLVNNKYYANGEIKIIGQYIDSKTKIACLCAIDGHQWDSRASHLLEGQGCPMCQLRHKRISLDEFLRRLKSLENSITAIDLYRGMKVRIRFRCKLGHIWSATPDDILHGRGCPYCSNRKVLTGFNDLWTTRPDVARMLKNPEDGYKYTKGSSKKLSFVCPDCKNEKQKIVADVCYQGLCCSHCGDGVSYPEKFGRAFLNLLPIDVHQCEYQPEWAKPYFYDEYFVYKNNAYIIEWDGAFHYKEKNGITQSLEERQKVDILKDELAEQHCIKMIRINCLYSEPNYIKKQILGSELKNIFDLSNIDWILCDVQAQSNFIKEACSLYSLGMTNLRMIGSKMNLCEDTIRRYLKKGSALNWCDYDTTLAQQQVYERKAKLIVLLNDMGDVIYKFRSARMCEKQMNNQYDITFTRSGIKWACKNHKPYKGFNFRFANETQQND